MESTRIQDRQFTEKGNLLPFLRRIFSYAYHYKRWFWGFIICVTIVAICDAVYPLLWMNFLDEVVTPLSAQYAEARAAGKTPQLDLYGVWQYAGYFAIVSIILVIGVQRFITYAGYIQERVMYDLRREMFQKLQQLQFSFFDYAATGWLLSRITSDAERVTELISWGFLGGIWGIIMIIACLTAMFYYHWQLASLVALSIPLLLVASIRIRMLILKYSREARYLNSEITAQFNEHIQGVEVNKITVQESRVVREFDQLTHNMRRASFRASYFTAMNMPLVIFIGSLAATLVLLTGGKMVVVGGITIGTLTAFFGYATQIFEPINDIANFYAQAQGCLSAGERIFSLLDETVTIKDQPNATPFGQIKGEITFDNVSFYYQDDKPILKNFSLVIPAGQSVALVGATGSGKSTISALACRFYEPTEGRVLIDGIDYTTRTLHSLRSQMGTVLQTPHLFNGTVRDNVKYACHQATDEQVQQAMQMVGAERFANRLDEQVGEGGENLSMGERQMLSFARAVLANPRILIMDEATSAIDTLTELAIQRGTTQLIANRTSIIIAHRLSTIKNCNRILVIQQGKIVEDGAHDQLIAQKGMYYQLYTQQLERTTT